MVKDFLGQNKVAKKGFKHDFAYIKGQTILLFSFLARGGGGEGDLENLANATFCPHW